MALDDATHTDAAGRRPRSSRGATGHGVRGTARTTGVRVSASDGTVTVVQARAAHVVERLGGPTRAAEVLGVARSQPGRWVRGTEAPSAAPARRLLDLDYVLARLEQLYEPATAQVWLRSPNAFLGGASPLDVLAADGPAEVVRAIDAAVAGSYA